jgi:hypothetical protein
MNARLWTLLAVAVLLVLASGVTFFAGIGYLPAALMFIAALVVLGVSMLFEDVLLRKYDTPHVDDSHPPALIFLRAMRTVVLITMAVLVFVMV